MNSSTLQLSAEQAASLRLNLRQLAESLQIIRSLSTMSRYCVDQVAQHHSKDEQALDGISRTLRYVFDQAEEGFLNLEEMGDLLDPEHFIPLPEPYVQEADLGETIS